MPGSMRLMYVSMHTSPADRPGSGDAGGMNVVELAQAMALAERGHRVELITRRSNPDLPEVMDLAPGVTLRQITAGPTARLAKSAIDAYIPDFSAGLAALDPVDLVHSHHWMSGVAALPVAASWGVPHVQSYHSIAAHPGSALAAGEPPESPARIPGEAFVAAGSDAIVTVSAAEARTAIERCGADPSTVTIVAPGVDTALFRPRAPGEPEPSATEYPHGYLLCAARLQPLKGPDLAIQALAGLPGDLRPRLLIAGDVSADFVTYERDLRAWVQRLGLSDDVRFIGPQSREDLATLLRGARAVLIPSHSETFGLVALEAAASGTPVVASAAGGLTEAVIDGETGLLVASREPAEWTEAIRRVLTEPGWAREHAAVARIHAKRMTWPRSAEHLERLYRELIAMRGGAQ